MKTSKDKEINIDLEKIPTAFDVSIVALHDWIKLYTASQLVDHLKEVYILLHTNRLFLQFRH